VQHRRRRSGAPHLQHDLHAPLAQLLLLLPRQQARPLLHTPNQARAHSVEEIGGMNTDCHDGQQRQDFQMAQRAFRRLPIDQGKRLNFAKEPLFKKTGGSGKARAGPPIKPLSKKSMSMSHLLHTHHRSFLRALEPALLPCAPTLPPVLQTWL
jgi:hypothetical protein